MRKPLLLLGAGGLLAFAVWRYATASGDGTAAFYSLIDSASDGATDLLEAVGVSMYSQDKVPQQYREAIANAEQANGMPAGLLARQLWQESRYRPDVISGAKRSPVGALGIAQFMPATARQYNVDPLDPFASIAAAGRMMRDLFKATGSWDKALASYNWGVGNVTRKGLAAAPLETRNYYAQILGDLGLA